MSSSVIQSNKFKRKSQSTRTTIDGHTLNYRKGADWYVDASRSGTGTGTSWDDAFLTMAEAFAKIGSGDSIYFVGKIKEQLTTPVQVFDVRVIGMGNRPRHADSTPAGGNTHTATWAFPDSPTASTPMVKVLQQGWQFENFVFSGASGQSCVLLFRDGGAGNAERDASHASFYNVRFDGGATHLEQSGGVAYIYMTDCLFRGATTKAILDTAGAGIGTNFNWLIENCRFMDNANHIVLAGNQCVLRNNVFGKFTTKSIDLSGSTGNNTVVGNALAGTYSHVGGYIEGTNDEWGGNFNSLTGGVTAALPA